MESLAWAYWEKADFEVEWRQELGGIAVGDLEDSA